MQVSIYSVRDDKAGAYLQPFYSPNENTARRAIANVVRDPDHMFGQNPEDYGLWSLGTFDDVTGKIIATTPEHMCSLLDLLPEREGAGSKS